MEMDEALTKEECAKAAKAINALAKKRFPEARIVRVEVTGSDDSYDNHPLVWIPLGRGHARRRNAGRAVHDRFPEGPSSHAGGNWYLRNPDPLFRFVRRGGRCRMKIRGMIGTTMRLAKQSGSKRPPDSYLRRDCSAPDSALMFQPSASLLPVSNNDMPRRS